MAGLDIQLQTITTEDGAALAVMTGAIDGNTVQSFQNTLEEIKAKGIQRLVLDMSKIKYVNSTGLGSLVKYADAFKSAGGGMALIKVPAKVKIVIEMLGLNAFFDICKDQDAALAALKSAGGAAPAAAASSAPPRTGGAAPPRVGSAVVQRPEPTQGQAPPASGGAGFPAAATCQGCQVQVDVPSAGSWKCPRCYTLINAQAGGGVSFGRSNGPVPINLSLTASRDCGEGLVHLVTAVCQQSIQGPKLEAIRIAVHEVAQVMQSSVYANNPNGVYHVSVERQQGRVQIRFADAGATIDQARAPQFFPNASASLAEFECRPHPSGGGNTIRLLQTA